MSVEFQFLLALYAIAATAAVIILIMKGKYDRECIEKLTEIANKAVVKVEESVKKTIAEADEIIKKAEAKVKSAPKKPAAKKVAVTQRKIVAPKK